MKWYEVLLPAVLANLLIRVDGLLVGPYWAFSEIVAGMGGTDADLWYENQRVRLAVFRRFFYLGLVGAAFSLYDADASGWDVALIGFIAATLLLWPIVFHGLPLGVARTDLLLVPLYTSMLGGFAASAAFGHAAVSFAREQSEGDLGRWARDQAMEAAIMFVLSLAFSAFFIGSYTRLKEKKRKRDSRGYEEP